MKNKEIEARTAEANQGRSAALALTHVRAIIEEMTTQIMENAVSANRSGELDGIRAQVAWGKIDAIWGLQDTLENQVVIGEAAISALAGQKASS